MSRALLLMLVVSIDAQCTSMRASAAAARGLAPTPSVVGLSQPTETVYFNGGDNITGDLFIMQSAIVFFQNSAGGPITIRGRIYLFDSASLSASGVHLSFQQTAPDQLSINTFDDSRVTFTGASADHGLSPDTQLSWKACGRSFAQLTNMDFNQGTRGSVAASVYENSSIVLDDIYGKRVEVTLADKGNLTAINLAQPLFTLYVYFVLNEPIRSIDGFLFGNVIAQSGNMRSATGVLDATYSITNCTTSWGFVLNQGANLVLNGSAAYLFPTYGTLSTEQFPLSALQPCSALISGGCRQYIDKSFSLAQFNVRFVNSQVYEWTPRFSTSRHFLADSEIGHSTCSSGATCFYNNVALDGAGPGVGFLVDGATAYFAGSTSTAASIGTNVFVRNGGTVIFNVTTFDYDPYVPDLRIQADDNSVVKLINSIVPTNATSTGNRYRLAIQPGSVFLRASLIPYTDLAVSSCGSILLPDVQMEVAPASAFTSFKLQVLDELQMEQASRQSLVGPWFQGGSAWGGASTLFQPNVSGVYRVAITTTAGTQSAVATRLINVTGCALRGCPYDLIGAIFANCGSDEFTQTNGLCPDECRTASLALTAWFGSMPAAARGQCVLNYPKVLNAVPVPQMVTIDAAAARLQGRDLCVAVANAAVQSVAPLLLLLTLSLVL